jgi:outer membrane protein assembly factor BamA
MDRGSTARIFLPIAIGLLTSCTGMKHTTEEKPMFTGFSINWTDDPVQNKKALTRELEGLVRPDPNNIVLGMRPTVALHNMIKEPKEPKGLGNTLRNKIGSAPVLIPDVPLPDITAAMANRLVNHGYFNAQSNYSVDRTRRKAKVTFTVSAGTPYRIHTITYADSSDELHRQIARTQDDSQVKNGDLYDLGELTTERSRVVSQVRNHGWYQLKADHLEFVADTSVGDHRLHLALRIKPGTAPAVLRKYTLGKIYVHGDQDPLLPPNDTTVVDSLYYINYLNNYRPSAITRGVFLKEGQHYSERQEDNTTRYLQSYGVFRNVEVRFTEDNVSPGVLKTDVLLYPHKRWSLFSELNATAKSNNFVGPGLRVGFKDRDLFRGAETFSADLNGNFETQVAGAQKGTNAYEFGGKISLQFPRIVPFHFLRTTRASVPITRIDLGYGLFRRINLYGLKSFLVSLNYNWKQNQRIWHEVSLIEVSYNNLYYSSDDFTTFLSENPARQRSFEQQFIIGTGYTFTISSKQRKPLQGWVLVSLGVDEAGNLLSMGMRASGPRPDGGYTLLGEVFSQYVRFRPELRYYQPLGRKGDMLATRLLVSAGLPYGNSEVLPYVKQFYSGGTNSLRAFRARSVGPGSYVPVRNDDALVDQTGDIKFEVNTEFRFTIAGFFKGALFADAGNIWLFNDDPQRPGAKFGWSTALDELALGAGFGLRFDPQVIVVRLDLATPLRDPALPKGDRWVFDDLKPKIFDNMVFNIAIGYPF